MTYMLRRAKTSDAIELAPRLRDADRAECEARLGLRPEIVLPLSAEVCDDTWTFLNMDGEPIAMMGVSPVDQNPHFGIVWMVSSDEIHKHKRALLKDAPFVLSMFHDKYELLGNHVDARNTAHIRWLKRMGFSMLRLMPKFGVEEVPFIEFAKLRTLECA